MTPCIEAAHLLDRASDYARSGHLVTAETMARFAMALLGDASAVEQLSRSLLSVAPAVDVHAKETP